MSECIGLKDADVVVVAYGTIARIVKEAADSIKGTGIKVGIIRPVTLWPYPDNAFDEINSRAKGVLCVEMSLGQMIDDVKIALNGRHKVYFHGRTGGMIPEAADIAALIKRIYEGSGGSK
jgi:2-oxoglutarate ferredoxin oxidoreductase subunit alpha